MNNLGFLLEKGGERVNQELVTAVKLYERPIVKGQHISAMNNLGNILENGRGGVEQDLGRAVQIYERAIAEGRHVYAMYNLAYLLEMEGRELNRI